MYTVACNESISVLSALINPGRVNVTPAMVGVMPKDAQSVVPGAQ